MDSVELLMRFENEFSIEIPDLEAEKMATAGDVATWLYGQINLSTPPKDLEKELFSTVERVFLDLNLVSAKLTLDTRLDTIIPEKERGSIWKVFEEKLALKVPKLAKADFSPHPFPSRKVFGITVYRPSPPFLSSSISRLIDCIGALNYKELIEFNAISSLFEVKIAVMGITEGFACVGIENVYWNSTFTSDLGID